MTLQSEKTTVDKPQNYCFEFLSQAENYKALMPDNTVKFECNDLGGFMFQLKGMPEIALQLQSKHHNDVVIWRAAGGKIDFTLQVLIEPIDSGTTTVQFVFNGELSSMMAMMVKKPLKNFIGTLCENFKTYGGHD